MNTSTPYDESSMQARSTNSESCQAVTVAALHHCHMRIDAWLAVASADLSPAAFVASDVFEAYSQAAIRFAGKLDDAR